MTDLTEHQKPVDQMSRADYVALLKSNLLLVTFRKTNGEIRHMKATQYQPYLDRVCPPRTPGAVDRPRKDNPAHSIVPPVGSLLYSWANTSYRRVELGGRIRMTKFICSG